MKKKLLIGGIGVLVVGGLFFSGSIVGANGDWKTKVINDTYSDLLDTGHNKSVSLVSNIETDKENVIQSQIQETISEQHAELERLLEQYYQMKLEGLTNTEEFKNLEAEIENTKTIVFERFQQDIDQAFDGM